MLSTDNNISGGYNGEVTPVPIPNTEVKLSSAEDTWPETARENMSLPDLYQSPERIAQGFVVFSCYCEEAKPTKQSNLLEVGCERLEVRI